MSSRERSSRGGPRPAAESERDLATAQDEIRTLQARASEDAADIERLRAELEVARARIATLEHEPDVVQATAFKNRLAQAEVARTAFERAASKGERESQVLQEQLASARELLRSAREQMTANAVASSAVVDQLAALQREADVAKAQSLTAHLTATTQLESQIRELTEYSATATAHADAAETKLRETQLRAQRVEGAVEQANARAANADARAAQLDRRVADHGVLARQADEEYALARKQIVALESRLAALQASVASSKAEAAKAVAVEAKHQAQPRADIEQMVAVAGEIAGVDASTSATDRAIRIAAALADQQVREAARRVEDAENRANMSETIARAMAKDVAEALHRAVEADLKIRDGARDLDDARHRADQAEAAAATAARALSETEQRVSDADARASRFESELEGASEKLGRISSANEAALESIRRELAAERSTALALTDCKRQLDRELAELRAQLSAAIMRTGVVEQRNVELAREVEAADNVRSFAAETEREIAQLQRQLHDARYELGELVAERERLTTALFEARNDGDSTNPRRELGEDTARYNLAAIEELLGRANALELRVVELERDNSQLRDQLARLKRRTR